MSGGTVPLRLISLILLFSLIPPARASYVAPKQIWTNKWDNCFAAAGARYGRCEQVPDMRSSYSSGAHPRGTS